MHSPVANALAMSAMKSKSCRCSPAAAATASEVAPVEPGAWGLEVCCWQLGPATCEGVSRIVWANFRLRRGSFSLPGETFPQCRFTYWVLPAAAAPLWFLFLSLLCPLLLLLKVCFLSLSREIYTYIYIYSRCTYPSPKALLSIQIVSKLIERKEMQKVNREKERKREAGARWRWNFFVIYSDPDSVHGGYPDQMLLAC